MSKILSEKFFDRDAVVVAEDLIGKNLVREFNGSKEYFQITETEAYVGPHDKACHAYKGRTARTEAMYGESGILYVYLVYGMHWMLNVVTCEKDYPAAVLIRGVGEYDGPGKLTRALNIDKSFNNKKAVASNKLWFEKKEGKKIEGLNIKTAPRIGVDYAGKEWASKPYRFIL